RTCSPVGWGRLQGHPTLPGCTCRRYPAACSTNGDGVRRTSTPGCSRSSRVRAAAHCQHAIEAKREHLFVGRQNSSGARGGSRCQQALGALLRERQSREGGEFHVIRVILIELDPAGGLSVRHI
ncbi:unnamed protein product, partial [Mycena citricolor]